MNHPLAHLMRVLVPSWRFFDGKIEAPVLHYRLSQDQQNFTEWKLAIPKTGERSWKNIFLNTRENFLFARHALLEHLQDDLKYAEDPMISLELTKNLVEFEIRHRQVFSEVRYFQFKLSCPDYLSPVFEWHP